MFVLINNSNSNNNNNNNNNSIFLFTRSNTINLNRVHLLIKITCNIRDYKKLQKNII